MACHESRAARSMLTEASELWPNRSRVSDGICPSAEHTKKNPTSYHETGDATDLTHDPANGCDAHAEAERLRGLHQAGKVARLDQIISNGRIATKQRGWKWRPSGGDNPHDHHAHFSHDRSQRGNVDPWFGSSAWAGVAEALRRLFSFLGALTPTVGPEVLDVQICKRKGEGGGYWMLTLTEEGPVRFPIPSERETTVLNGYKSCGGKVGQIDSQGLALYKEVDAA